MTIGAANAYRRMIYEDERRPRAEQLGFVLHLGDFIYEVVKYPDEVPEGKDRGRRVRPLFKYPDGDKFGRLPPARDARGLPHGVPRRTYRPRPAGRARPLAVRSGVGQPRVLVAGIPGHPGVRRQAAPRADQEGRGQPGVVGIPAGACRAARREQAIASKRPAVKDAPDHEFDENGFGLGADNLRGRREPHHLPRVPLRPQRRADPHRQPLVQDRRRRRLRGGAGRISEFIDEDAARVIDDGRTANGGKPPATLRFAGKDIPNPGVDQPMQTYLGPKQRAWLIERLSASQAPWKVWGHSFGTLAWRTDLANLPEEWDPKWPGTGFGLASGGYYSEHAQIYDVLRQKGVTGLAVVAGDKHSFWAGLTSADLPPRAYDPVGVEFVTGSISAQGFVEIGDLIVKHDDALRALYYTGEKREIPAINYTYLHGVRAALALSRTSAAEARKLHNPEVAPHLKFVDLGGHGYGLVTVTADWLETEFVCIPVPFERSESADGGPLRYRVRHRVNRWKAGEQPKLAQTVVEGNADYSI